MMYNKNYAKRYTDTINLRLKQCMFATFVWRLDLILSKLLVCEYVTFSACGAITIHIHCTSSDMCEHHAKYVIARRGSIYKRQLRIYSHVNYI